MQQHQPARVWVLSNHIAVFQLIREILGANAMLKRPAAYVRGCGLRVLIKRGGGEFQRLAVVWQSLLCAIVVVSTSVSV
jgi:hypothetical protein